MAETVALNTDFLKPSKRISNIPTYVFAELEVMKKAAQAQGRTIIDLGIGSPDQTPPQPVLDAAIKSIQDPTQHGYPSFQGKDTFRKAVVQWMKRRYDVTLDYATEVQTLIGSKEGIAHIALAYIDAGDVTLACDPYYPVHSRGTWVAGGIVHHLPLTAENKFLPKLADIPTDVAKKAKLIFVNYPHNPTSAIAPLSFYQELVEFCKHYEIVLCSDLAYAEIGFEGYRPPSVFNVEGAKDIAIEFHSFSKTFNMAGWRAAFAVGNADIVKALYSVKSNMDYGTSNFIQDACIAAMAMPDEYFVKNVEVYKRRRDIVIDGFNDLGWHAEKPKATMYTWLPIPDSIPSSKAWTQLILDKADTIVTPGIAFGNCGDRYFRISLVADEDKLKVALAKIKAAGIRFK
jgi:LL-diaminopimelate aminotransferase